MSNRNKQVESFLNSLTEKELDIYIKENIKNKSFTDKLYKLRDNLPESHFNRLSSDIGKNINDIINNYYNLGQAIIISFVLECFYDSKYNINDIQYYLKSYIKNNKTLKEYVYEIMKDYQGGDNISATNRGGKRVKSDFYSTPIPVIKHFLKNYKLKDGDILEPSAGNGNFIKALIEDGYKNNITAIELRKEEYDNLISIADNVIIQDFLTYIPAKQFATIIGNPPYSLAQEFLEHCFAISDVDTEIIMLLRTAFLESKKRYNFWQKHPVSNLYVLSQRPSFTGKGTDATSYAWFIWNNNKKQEIKVI